MRGCWCRKISNSKICIENYKWTIWFKMSDLTPKGYTVCILDRTNSNCLSKRIDNKRCKVWMEKHMNVGERRIETWAEDDKEKKCGNYVICMRKSFRFKKETDERRKSRWWRKQLLKPDRKRIYSKRVWWSWFGDRQPNKNLTSSAWLNEKQRIRDRQDEQVKWSRASKWTPAGTRCRQKETNEEEKKRALN